MPSDLVLKSANSVHRAILKLTGGRVASSFKNMPVLELRTTGRKSGQEHTVLLTSPAQEGETMVVVASRGGDDHHPAWFLNLREHSDVEVKVHGETRQMRARVATAEERQRLWPQVTAQHGGYAGYQRKTEREIPLVMLEPAN